jgi:hypothetical protein
VYLPPLKPPPKQGMSSFSLPSIFYPQILSDVKSDEIQREMMFKGLHEDYIQSLHKTTPEQLTDQDLLLSTISEVELVRKHFGGWVKEYPKCFFCSKALRFKTFTVQCHMTSQITSSGKHKCKTTVCEFENKKDDSPLKTRFLTVRNG